MKSSGKTANHIFISYSHDDKDFAQKLVEDLKQLSIPVWIDTESLIPGTPDWQRAIREAIKAAFAILLVASPNAGESVYVHAELKIASTQERPVYTVWARGEDWIECVPLEMVNAQYVDCRNEEYARGLKLLTDTLKRNHLEHLSESITRDLPEIFAVSSPDECPPGFLPIILPAKDTNLEKLDDLAGLKPALAGLEYQTIVAALDSYMSLQPLLNDIYVRYLRDRYEPRTYGQDWLLVSATRMISRLIVPWSWLIDRNAPYRNNHLWAKTSLDDWRISAETTWGIIDITYQKIPAFGLATSDPKLAKFITSIQDNPERLVSELDAALMNKSKVFPSLTKANPNEVNFSNYEYSFVLSSPQLVFEEPTILVALY